MLTIAVERTIDAPIEDVFDWCAATGNWERSRWVLHNRLATAGQGAPYGIGAIRVHTWLIGWFYERITAYDPPTRIEYVVERSFPPSRHEGGQMTFAATPAGTHVTWVTMVGLRLPLMGDLITRMLAAPIIRLVFGNILDHCAKALMPPAGPQDH